MKYVRTKDGKIVKHPHPNAEVFTFRYEILKIADTIEELCDELVVVQKDFHDLLNADTHCLQTLKRYYEINKIEVLGIYGAIWTDKGLTYVAKMNEKGELELL